MNFLAHLCLANGDSGLMLGGLFGDFVRGRRALRAYPEPVMQGIVLHQGKWRDYLVQSGKYPFSDPPSCRSHYQPYLLLIPSLLLNN